MAVAEDLPAWGLTASRGREQPSQPARVENIGAGQRVGEQGREIERRLRRGKKEVSAFFSFLPLSTTHPGHEGV